MSRNAWFETVAEAQRRAKDRLPAPVYGALIAGSEKGITLDDNIAAYSELGVYELRPDLIEAVFDTIANAILLRRTAIRKDFDFRVFGVTPIFGQRFENEEDGRG